MSQFMLILRDDPSQYADLGPDEMQSIIARYTAWGEKLGERHTGGHKLADGGGAAVMRGSGGAPVVTDGPYGETKEVIGGFFLVEADDLAHAIELCRDHPQLDDAGSIEIRQLDELAHCNADPAKAKSAAGK